MAAATSHGIVPCACYLSFLQGLQYILHYLVIFEKFNFFGDLDIKMGAIYVGGV